MSQGNTGSKRTIDGKGSASKRPKLEDEGVRRVERFGSKKDDLIASGAAAQFCRADDEKTAKEGSNAEKDKINKDWRGDARFGQASIGSKIRVWWEGMKTFRNGYVVA